LTTGVYPAAIAVFNGILNLILNLFSGRIVVQVEIEMTLWIGA